MKRQKGFTLIELLITLAIVGILAGLAYPAYTGYVTAARRAEAKVALMAFANGMQRYYSINSTYTDAANASGVPIASVSPSQAPDTGTPYYNLTATIPAGGATYTLSATPITGTSQASDPCGTLTITDTGATGASTTGCW